MKKYAFAGASLRGIKMYAVPLAEEFSDVAQIVGVYDINPNRAALLKEKTGLDFPVFSSFEDMIAQAKPDVVIITTIDRYHHEYIIKSLNAGCDAITEKPMTIDAEKCKAILEAEKRTGKKVTVTFNYRFTPFAARIKELVTSGIIGECLSVHFEWMLGTPHGSDYFRRWHRNKENSGGLLVHKATHHFDLINWFIGQDPVRVNAFGALRYYGPNRDIHEKRCHTCAHKAGCEFYLDLSKDEVLKSMYLDSESVDGYFRDKCVFSDEIDIEDTICANVKYSGGAIMSYSLNAHSPYEGYKLSLNGTKGRLEAEDFHSDEGIFAKKRIYKLRVYNRYGEEVVYNMGDGIWGGHGGGDPRLRNMIFRDNIPDPLGQQATSRAGAMSIIIGIAANESIRSERSVSVKELLGNSID